MRLNFSKYHGTGNDFIMIDNRDGLFPGHQKLISGLCDRHKGIGADGLITLNMGNNHLFGMKYYNANGLEGSMCGNGGRCFTQFLKSLQLTGNTVTFEAIDGIHEASITEETGLVALKLNNVANITRINGNLFINTGSPHYIVFTNNNETTDVYTLGKQIRYNREWFPEGTNVDFVQIIGKTVYVRTYERGVEDETLSCGTGVTASAIACFLETGKKETLWKVLTKGGSLQVSFFFNNNTFSDIWLEGPAVEVFKGTMVLEE